VGNAYGTAELGFLAVNTTGGLLMQLLPLPIVQVVAPDSGQSVGPGEAGEVVVTNLDPAYPLIRLGTGDLAVNVDPNPGLSCQQDRSIILVGRSGEAVKIRGMFVHPNQLRFAVAQVAPGAAVQGVVDRQDHQDIFGLRVTLPASSGASDMLASAIQEAVRQACRVRVDWVQFMAEGDIAEDAARAGGSATLGLNVSFGALSIDNTVVCVILTLTASKSSQSVSFRRHPSSAEATRSLSSHHRRYSVYGLQYACLAALFAPLSWM
jgi:acyl-CoA synthetase (AMP-forming)/AMP-acid ligase II